MFLNDGTASADQVAGTLYGSQHEQDDARTQLGANLRVSRTFTVARIDVRSTAGLQLREDLIEAQLHRTEQRQRLDGLPGIPGPIFDGQITETELGAYAEFDAHLTPWLRVVLAGREDRGDAAVNNESPAVVYQTSGFKGASQFSPKATVIVSPLSQLDLFANVGQGFHTNDARSTLLGVINGVPPTLIAQATGYEVGATVRPFAGLTLTAVGFLLDITQELTVDGDTDTTAPSGATRRFGAELVSPLCRCSSFEEDAGACGGASASCGGASVGFTCVPGHTPAELNGILACEVSDGGPVDSFCCRTP